MAKKVRRTTHRSSTGTKLYAVRDAGAGVQAGAPGETHGGQPAAQALPLRPAHTRAAAHAGSADSPPAPITYVAAQMGLATPATTLRFYARWIPRQGRRYIEGPGRPPARG